MNPIILADNRFQDATPTASSTAAGFDPRNIADVRPYTWWQAATPGTNFVMVDCGSPAYADCLGVIGHNLHSAAALVSLETSIDGATWTARLAPFTLSSDRACLRPCTGIYARFWRLTIVTATVAPWIAVAMVGRRIDFPFPPDHGTPWSENVVDDSANSKVGNPLGTVVRYFPVDIKPQFSVVDRDWVDTVYRPFRANYSRWRKYFFWAQDLDTWPDVVFLVRDIGKYEPSVSVLAYYDALKLEFQGVMEP